MLMALLGLAAGGCRPSRSPSTVMPWVPGAAPDLGAVVARIGDVPIFAAELRAQVETTGKAPRVALDELVAFHLLAERARQEWPPRTPAAVELHKQLLVQRLIEREFEPSIEPGDVPEAELRALYDRALYHYVHPRLVEVAVAWIGPGFKPTRETRAAARATGQDFRAYLDKRKERTPEDLQAAASDPMWKGRVHYRKFMQGNDKPQSRVFGDAVQKLKAPGDTTPVVEDPEGVYVARYVSEQPPRNTSFDEARAELHGMHFERWKQNRFIEMTGRIGRQHDVELRPAALAATPPPGS